MPRSRPLAEVLALLLLATCFSACSGPERRGDQDIQVRLQLDPDPPQVGPSGLSVIVTDLQWRPYNGASVTVTGIRDEVTLVSETAQGQGAGRYDVPEFGFEVTGAWTVRVRVELGDGRWTEVEQAVEVGAPEEDGAPEGA